MEEFKRRRYPEARPEEEKEQSKLIEKQSALAERARKIFDSPWRSYAPLVELDKHILEKGIIEVGSQLIKALRRMEERISTLEYGDRYRKNMPEATHLPLEAEQLEVDQEAIEAYEKFLKEVERAEAKNDLIARKKVDSIVFDFLKRRFDDFVAKIETLDLNAEQKQCVVEWHQVAQKVIEEGRLPNGKKVPPRVKAYPGAFLMDRIEAVEGTTQKRLF